MSARSNLKDLNSTVGSMVMENTVMFSNCCSSQAITDRNLKLGRVVEKASKCLTLFSRVKIKKNLKCERE